jgi:lipoprotein-anchoring transpeptidase ErfK/SrfK
MQLPLGVSAKLGEAAAWQAALGRAGFSPGIIDGLVGPKTVAGLRAFQENAGLPVTGEFDAATRRAIGLDSTPATSVYVITEADRAAVGPCPSDWVAKSKLRRLGFASLEQVAANRGHCRRDLLAKLNPGLDLKSLEPGSRLIVPNVRPRKQNVRAAAIEIDFGTKIVRAFDRRGGLVCLFHCSIAREKQQRPSGRCEVKTVTTDPTYTFKPESWPEVKGVHRRLIIPPGPRNPVGLCWIGLTKQGYGIHGTPQPELIGKTGSHGCFRMTNWDILHLAEIVRVGVEVRFVDSTGQLARGG